NVRTVIPTRSSISRSTLTRASPCQGEVVASPWGEGEDEGVWNKTARAISLLKPLVKGLEAASHCLLNPFSISGLIPLHRIQRTKPIEHLDINVPGSGSLSRPYRRSLQHLLLLLLSCLARLGLARLLGLKRPLIRVELGLVPDKDLALVSSGKYIINFPLVLHGRDPVHGQLAYLLLLLRRGDRLRLKACLRQQRLFLGDRGLAGAGGLACCDQRQDHHGSDNTC